MNKPPASIHPSRKFRLTFDIYGVKMPPIYAGDLGKQLLKAIAVVQKQQKLGSRREAQIMVHEDVGDRYLTGKSNSILWKFRESHTIPYAPGPLFSVGDQLVRHNNPIDREVLYEARIVSISKNEYDDFFYQVASEHAYDLEEIIIILSENDLRDWEKLSL